MITETKRGERKKMKEVKVELLRSVKLGRRRYSDNELEFRVGQKVEDDREVIQITRIGRRVAVMLERAAFIDQCEELVYDAERVNDFTGGVTARDRLEKEIKEDNTGSPRTVYDRGHGVEIPDAKI